MRRADRRRAAVLLVRRGQITPEALDAYREIRRFAAQCTCSEDVDWDGEY
jgi:hypothetical protein